MVRFPFQMIYGLSGNWRIECTIGIDRHTYSTLLRANGEDVTVVQGLLRHANSKTTMDTYTQAPSPAKRTAQSRVIRTFVGKKRRIWLDGSYQTLTLGARF
jgi:integrase